MSKYLQILSKRAAQTPALATPAQEGDIRAFGSKLAVLMREYLRLIEPDPAPMHIHAELDQLEKMEKLGRQADWIYKARRRRANHFEGDLFGEAAWDIMLDLFSSECKGKAVSVTSVCIASSVPATTALRWIALLREAGMLERQHDPDDRRRAFVALTEQGRSSMVSYLEATMSG